MTTPEDKARELIDQRVQQVGWLVQDMAQFNPAAILRGQDVKAGVAFDARPEDRQSGAGQGRVVLRPVHERALHLDAAVGLRCLEDFVACFWPENRHQREPGERLHCYSCDELLERCKARQNVSSSRTTS